MAQGLEVPAASRFKPAARPDGQPRLKRRQQHWKRSPQTWRIPASGPRRPGQLPPRQTEAQLCLPKSFLMAGAGDLSKRTEQQGKSEKLRFAGDITLNVFLYC